jgi:hypothetical protein
MKHTFIGLMAGSALLLGSGLAAAQDSKIMDGNNPAPNPAPMAAAAHGAQMPSKIVDGNNPAPNPGPIPAAAHGATTSSKIMDGNNPAPNPAASVAPARQASGKKHKGAS